MRIYTDMRFTISAGKNVQKTFFNKKKISKIVWREFESRYYGVDESHALHKINVLCFIQ